MLLPIALILLALIAVSVYAFGTLPSWGAYHHGIQIIVWSRRLEAPMLVTAFLLCLGLAILVISGKKRAEWLIGLVPVAILVIYRAAHSPTAGMSSVQDPAFIKSQQVGALADTDQIVGLIVDGVPTAFPCTSLYRYPVLIRTGREKPVVLFWSAWANRALAFYADRDLRASDLDIVSTPDDSLLVYNSRLGEFINATTGVTTAGAVPTGIHAPLPVYKTTWLNWRTVHPDTLIAALRGADGDFSAPQPQKDPLPGNDPALTDRRRVCLVASTQPLAVPINAVTDRPLNLTSGQTPVLLVRVNGMVRAFSRELPGDLVPRFSPFLDAKHKNVAWIDSDTNSEWTDTGIQVEGPKDMHGMTLRPLTVEDDDYFNVLKFWYPDLHIASDQEIAAAAVVEKAPVEKPPTKRRRNSKPQ